LKNINKLLLVLVISGALFSLSAQGALPKNLPAFKLMSIDGKEVSTADYKGKAILINFWATWCPPCVREIPDLIKIHTEEANLVVLGISVDLEKEKVAPFAKSKGINYPVLFGNTDVVSTFGGIRFIPQSFLYAPNGKLIKKFEGLVSEKELKAALKEIN